MFPLINTIEYSVILLSETRQKKGSGRGYTALLGVSDSLWSTLLEVIHIYCIS